MRLNQRSKKLAAVLLEIAQDAGGDVYTSLQTIDNLLKKDARFKSLFLSKRITLDQKVDVFRSVLAEVCHPIVIEFLGLITKENSVLLIRQVIQAYTHLYKDKEGIVAVTAHVANEMKQDEIKTFQEKLEMSLAKKVDLNIQLDQKLLGGIKLRIENTFLDASLQNNLNRLRGELLQS